MPRSLSAPSCLLSAGRMAGLVLLVAAGGAGCSADAPPAAAPSAAATPSPSASVTEVDDPPGTITCHKLAEAVTTATLMDPGVVDGIVAASSTADAPVADSAHRLATAYASALTARGTDGEPDAIAAVSAAGADMSGVCDDSGLETVG
ncbi:MAG TPA: hypothetical protein VGP57_01420 [Actinoplanes sp.]|nr:hypothetical protein [Actinoplanes sp.]